MRGAPSLETFSFGANIGSKSFKSWKGQKNNQQSFETQIGTQK
jgi:hypothetical protein